MCPLKNRFSNSGIHHVMTRGTGRQIIFEDDCDRRWFLERLASYSDEDDISVLAYCLMPNHVHMLLLDSEGALSHMLHKLLSAYAHYFNNRHRRTGHLLEARFVSKSVETDAYLLEAVRYIHDNPEKGGICLAADYPWSSFSEYVGEPKICDTSLVMDCLGSVEAFSAFSCAAGDKLYSLPDRRAGWSPDELLEEASSILTYALGVQPDEVKRLSPTRRDDAVSLLLNSGFSHRQVEKICGIGRWTISRIAAVAKSDRQKELPTQTG